MAGKSNPLAKKARTNLDFYHSPTQLRVDTWHRLEEYTSRLKKQQGRPGQTSGTQASPHVGAAR